jgi:hypothetical protein
MKFVIAPAKPRNPLVAPALRRRAGSHRSSGKALRQQSRQTLRRELSHVGAEQHGP